MQILRSLILAATLYAPSVWANSGSICGLSVVGGQGLASVDYEYYQVETFVDAYNDLAARSDLTPEACWDIVEAWLRPTRIVSEFGWSTTGAPDAYRAWYEEWFRSRFLNVSPDWQRSSFPGSIELRPPRET